MSLSPPHPQTHPTPICSQLTLLAYTFVAMTRFDNMDDVRYYDEECEAHKRLKEFAHDKVQQPWEPPLTVFFED